MPMIAILLVVLMFITSAYFGSKQQAGVGATPTAAIAATPAPPTPTATPSPTTGLYPMLASSYAGTVYAIVANRTSSLYLTKIQQDQGTIRGIFQGLGMAGPFKGTVTRSGKLSFTVTINSSEISALAGGSWNPRRQRR